MPSKRPKLTPEQEDELFDWVKSEVSDTLEGCAEVLRDELAELRTPEERQARANKAKADPFFQMLFIVGGDELSVTLDQWIDEMMLDFTEEN